MKTFCHTPLSLHHPSPLHYFPLWTHHPRSQPFPSPLVTLRRLGPNLFIYLFIADGLLGLINSRACHVSRHMTIDYSHKVHRVLRNIEQYNSIFNVLPIIIIWVSKWFYMYILFIIYYLLHQKKYTYYLFLHFQLIIISTRFFQNIY